MAPQRKEARLVFQVEDLSSVSAEPPAEALSLSCSDCGFLIYPGWSRSLKVIIRLLCV